MSSYKFLLMLIFSMLLGNSVVVLAADLYKGLKASRAGDFETALTEWTPLAEQGDADAQFLLGNMYYDVEASLQTMYELICGTTWGPTMAVIDVPRIKHSLLRK